jgi:hypothetical protein
MNIGIVGSGKIGGVVGTPVCDSNMSGPEVRRALRLT